MSRPESRLPLHEALLAALCLGCGVLLAEIVQVASVRLLHLSGLTFRLSIVRVLGLYAAAFVAVGAAAWLVTLPLRRLPAGRRGALLFLAAACAAPSAVYPFKIPTGGYRPGSFYGLRVGACVGILVACWIAAAWASRRAAREGAAAGPSSSSRRPTWVALPFCLLPFAASALVLAGGFALENVEGRPLHHQGLPFHLFQAGVACSAAWLFARRLVAPPAGVRPWVRIAAGLSASLVVLAVGGRAFFLGLPSRHAGPKALLIVIDTLRADALSMYGGPVEDTPNLARFREDAILFEQCVSPSPWTLPSFASLFTSTYPSEHLAGARFSRDEKGVGPIRAQTVTMAEVLVDAGFRTGASLTNSNLERIPNIGRGFERFSNGHSPQTYHPTSAWIELRLFESREWYPLAELQTRWILDELAMASRDPRPFLLLGHYSDPHHPYQSPDEFLPEVDGELTVLERYRGEVRYLDFGLGELFEELRTRGLYDDLCIVVTADHGEELDELRRGRKKVPDSGQHGHTLFQEQLHVPLLVKLPGQRGAGTTRGERVTLLDLAPTLLAQLGVEAPAGFRGWDLFDPRNDARYGSRVLLAEGLMRHQEQRAGFLGDLKVVLPDLPPEETRPQLFRLTADPGELAPTNLEGAAAEEVYQALLAHLRFWAARRDDAGGETGEPGEGEASTDPALLMHMKALGYTE